MSVTEEPQLGIEEKVLEADGLEGALEERERRKNSKNELNRQFKEADERARALIGEFDLADGEVARCGRFKIAKTKTQARSVSFETSPKTRVTIKADPDDL